MKRNDLKAINIYSKNDETARLPPVSCRSRRGRRPVRT